MRKPTLVATALFALIMSVAGYAQQADPDRLAEFEARVEEARERLQLSDEQVEQIRPVMVAGAEAMAEALESHGIDLSIPAEQRERPGFRKLRALSRDLKAVREESTEAMAAILTEEQMRTYREMQEERSEQMRDQIRGRR